MRAAVYARYSSENQQKESIDDQVAACRRLAKGRGFQIIDEHIYADQARSGARKDRPGLDALLGALPSHEFEIVLVDDLSRLARDNYLMLSVLAEVHFEGIRVVSVADGLDSNDEEATLGIQIRGIFNELQLRDLKKKTLRGQLGQKERGFFVGERTFGYRSVPVGEMRMDEKGRPRPDGYAMEIEASEAATILRIFKSYADGQSLSGIVKTLNAEGVPRAHQDRQGLVTGHDQPDPRQREVHRPLGLWVWNRTETRGDPRSGRRRRVEKPESEWVVREDATLRIVPEHLWDAVRGKRTECRKSWPGRKKQRGFSNQKGGSETHFPTNPLSGTMACGRCGASIAQVSGKSGGYYGCLGAGKGACDNKLLVRRKLAEKVIVEAIREQLSTRGRSLPSSRGSRRRS